MGCLSTHPFISSSLCLYLSLFPLSSLPHHLPNLTSSHFHVFPRHPGITHLLHAHPPSINKHVGKCMYARLLIWRATAAVNRSLLGVLCPCTAMIQNNKTGLTHTHSEEVVYQDKKKTCLSLLSPSLCLLLFFSPLTLFFVCLFVFLPLKSFPTVSLLLANSPPLSIRLFSPLSLSPSPERHHPDCKQR